LNTDQDPYSSHSYAFISVADPECLSRIWIFPDPGSQIPDHAKKEEVNFFFSNLFNFFLESTSLVRRTFVNTTFVSTTFESTTFEGMTFLRTTFLCTTFVSTMPYMDNIFLHVQENIYPPPSQKKIVFKLSEVMVGSEIQDPDPGSGKKPIPDPGSQIQGSKCTESCIPDPDRQHWYLCLMKKVFFLLANGLFCYLFKEIIFYNFSL